MDDLVIQVIGGVSRGMVLFIVAAGLTLIFGALRVANFAHGAIYMLGAYVAFGTARAVGFGVQGFVLGLLIAPLIVGVVGYGVERFALRRISDRSHYYQLILTYAIALIIADVIKAVWGISYHTLPRPPGLEGAMFIRDAIVPYYNLFVIAIGLLTAAAIHQAFNRTHFGLQVRAAMLDGEMLAALGTSVRALKTKVFVIGCALAGAGGAIAAPLSSISLGMDHSVIIESFAVVLIGGVGSVFGALVGALLVGVIQAIGILYVPEFSVAMVYIVLSAVLVLKPEGILGRTSVA
ncbi:branched-chain amino acid ABC transporter permease [Micromonospora sp. STR1s_5]|nr:branched-chain amino acid ABC transporter permease [Micromonospora sp. STR1s_5]